MKDAVKRLNAASAAAELASSREKWAFALLLSLVEANVMDAALKAQDALIERVRERVESRLEFVAALDEARKAWEQRQAALSLGEGA